MTMANEYIINSKLEEIIAKFQEAKHKRLKDQKYQELYELHQEELAYFFYELSANIMRTFNFKLLDPDDALQEGVLIALQKVDRFDHTFVGKKGQKAKAFNYLTTCILNHFKQLHRGVKNRYDLQRRYYEHLIDQMDNVLRDWGNQGNIKGRFIDNDNKKGDFPF